MGKIQNVFHRYCSGSINEKGKCFIPSSNYKLLENEILEIIENEMKNCGLWDLSSESPPVLNMLVNLH